jgi:AcrR family transcriptional regulator
MHTALRPTPRAEQKTVTRNRVLGAAVRVFGEKSFVGASMEDIARAAGVTRVTVYAHFGGKTEIIRALSDQVFDIAGAVYTDLADRPQWTRAVIRDWLDAAVTRWRELAPTIHALAAAGPMVAGDTDRSRDRYLGAHERYVATLAEDRHRWRGVARADARQRALMAVLQLESFLSLWIAAGWEPETGDPLDLLADTLCHVLGPALDQPAETS